MKIGIDIGKVIIDSQGDDTQFFGENWLSTPMMEGALETITDLASRHEIFIISKCGAKVEERSRVWLSKHCFFEQTGVSPENLFFVRKRPQKAVLAQSLELDVFVDDREDIISTMKALERIADKSILFKDWATTAAIIRKIERFGKVF